MSSKLVKLVNFESQKGCEKRYVDFILIRSENVAQLFYSLLKLTI